MKQFVFLLLILGLIGAVVLRVRYGGGEPYEDLSTTPLFRNNAVAGVLRYPEPLGSVAVSRDGRLFFTVHPASRPLGNKLLEWVEGAAVPFPDGAAQPRLFDSVMALEVDALNRLWALDHGNHGMGEARLLAFDIGSGEVLLEFHFGSDIAPAGSYFKDLAVTADGNTVFIADASIWRKRPAIVIFDVGAGRARRVLESHPAISAEDYVIRSKTGELDYFGGLINVKAGLSGIALDGDDEWLYLGAMNNDSVYRAHVPRLTDRSLSADALDAAIQKYSRKPMSGGMTVGPDGNLYITDVEHGAIQQITDDRQLQTLAQSPAIRWPDGLALGTGDWIYVADSALPAILFKTREDIKASGPYYIYRMPVDAAAELSL